MNKLVSTAVNSLTIGGLCTILMAGMSGPVWAKGPSYFQVADMQDFNDPNVDLPGAARLTRNPQEMWLSIHTTGLDPIAAYTVWWVIFNNPGYCSDDECGENDLGDPNVGAAIFYATAFISDVQGVGNASAHLKAGALPEGVETIDLGNGAPPRLRSGNGLRAEAHVIVRSHGDVIAGEADLQLGTGDFGVVLPGCCADQQFAVFLPI